MLKKSKRLISIILVAILLFTSLHLTAFSIENKIESLSEKDRPSAVPIELVKENMNTAHET